MTSDEIETIGIEMHPTLRPVHVVISTGRREPARRFDTCVFAGIIILIWL